MDKMAVIRESTSVIKGAAKEKILEKKNDPAVLALYLVEFFLTLILVAGILLYLDGRFNSLEFPFNLLIFGAIAYGVMHFYNYTSLFRNAKGMRRNESMKSFALEFVIFIVIVASAYFYQDESINIVPYPFNYLVFLIILGIPLYFYIQEKYLKA